ncbi:MAG: DUF488 family protein, partial [Bacteroidota bacterium]
VYYRRKVILALLQLFQGELEKIRLQKLLFLFTQEQETKIYDFVPYLYGCYSYSANADLTTMVNKDFLAESEKSFTRKDKTNYLATLTSQDFKLLMEVKDRYGNMNADALMKHTYVNFPYWAIKSVRAQSILTDREMEKVYASQPVGKEVVLFTIGYEGISLEEYLNRLLINDVKILVDVRNNPMSMKYGFSKSQLKRYCGSLGIEYLHLPEVGIQSNQRQELNEQGDYDRLFKIYRENNLSKTINVQNQILSLLVKHQRIALTCFEANICQCHRKHLAEAIEKLPGFEYAVRHI